MTLILCHLLSQFQGLCERPFLELLFVCLPSIQSGSCAFKGTWNTCVIFWENPCMWCFQENWWNLKKWLKNWLALVWMSCYGPDSLNMCVFRCPCYNDLCLLHFVSWLQAFQSDQLRNFHINCVLDPSRPQWAPWNRDRNAWRSWREERRAQVQNLIWGERAGFGIQFTVYINFQWSMSEHVSTQHLPELAWFN